jgi:hypothetical protein
MWYQVSGWVIVWHDRYKKMYLKVVSKKVGVCVFVLCEGGGGVLITI